MRHLLRRAALFDREPPFRPAALAWLEQRRQFPAPSSKPIRKRRGADPRFRERASGLLASNAHRPALYRTSRGVGFSLGWSIHHDTGRERNRGLMAPAAWQWGGVYGHSWFVDPENAPLRRVSFTNTALAGVHAAPIPTPMHRRRLWLSADARRIASRLEKRRKLGEASVAGRKCILTAKLRQGERVRLLLAHLLVAIARRGARNRPRLGRGGCCRPRPPVRRGASRGAWMTWPEAGRGGRRPLFSARPSWPVPARFRWGPAKGSPSSPTMTAPAAASPGAAPMRSPARRRRRGCGLLRSMTATGS